MNALKTFAYAIAALAVALLSGCSAENAVSQMEKEHIATIRHVHAEIAKGNIDVFDEVLAPNYVRHCQAMPPELQEMHGSAELKRFVGDFIAAVSDIKETFDVIMADSDKVAYVTTTTGRQTGPMGGFPATGKTFKTVSIIIQRFEKGKIAETWVTWDNLAFLSQLSLFPPPKAK